ncbi:MULTISPECIES: GNAT family N-acetyltransferase [unclassified Pseudactinotalea]|uniref:GNAT family N-acetyltransferase n=1 Tax=unclassified Pseudactinotalea TaxID=2649176 RepID=UPI00128B5258|nr:MULTISPECIES: GNAT family N-acetyltransferase [unclassified Pseudactinotalea]MPV48714.1 GNAT family N-acetyltransferase [Pseudactinotalea sp. HY160]QGH68706.1 GNAT family N-acetyltransferase [Pseudactinotalea sp. HY158]
MTEDVRHGPVGVRDTAAEDAEFLIDMLLEEVNWGLPEPISRRQLLRDRVLSQYVAGWQREGDLGVVAVDTGGPNGLQIPVGAAWLRRFTAQSPGQAFIATTVPELSLGVIPAHRGRGIEMGLVHTLIGRARDAGITRIAAFVAAGHPSREFYDAAGFTQVRDEDGGHVLVLDLLGDALA